MFGVEQDIEVGMQVTRGGNVKNKGLMKHLEIMRRAAQVGSAHVNNVKREPWFQI